jgi:uncharacterized protein YxjI
MVKTADHEYGIERDEVKVAEVSRRWFRICHMCGVERARAKMTS